MRGRKPLPTAMKVLAGNPGKRALNRQEATPRRTLPRAPQHLDEEARAEWKRSSRELWEAGLLTAVDRAALAAYCQAFSRWAQAERKVKQEGMVIVTMQGNVVQSPYVSIANRAMELMMKAAAEFGMTPSARTRVAAQRDERDKSLAEQLFEAVNHD